MYTTIIDMLKYAHRTGLILLLLLCLSGAATAQQYQQPLNAQEESVADGKTAPSNSILWFWDLDDTHSGALIKSLIIVISICIVCLMVLLIWIMINRNRMEAREAETQNLLEKYESLLFDYLVAGNNDDVTSATRFNILFEIDRISKYEFNRGILINQMHELTKSMSLTISIGQNKDAREQLRDLYYQMNLDQDSIRKLYNPKWHVQVKGFREMAFMNVTEANSKIHLALKSKNNVLRMEAQLALVRLNEDDPFGFLDHLTHPFTLWEQLNVYELILLHDLPIPQFSRWTTSSNKTVVIFALRMIQVFKQLQAAPQLIACLHHPDRDVRYTAIVVSGEIQMRECLPHLKQMYKTEDYANCRAIILAMSKMPDEMMLNFLKLVLDKEDDVQLQIESAKAISKMGEVGVAALVKLMKSEYKNYQIIIRHVLDKRIN